MEYTDIKIIECNKRQSIGASDITGHNALFTNKLGENIMLEEGDTIEVEYSFINEKGCGSDTIEIEGKDLGVVKDFVYVVDDTLGTYRGIDIVNPTTNKPLYPVMPTLSREQVITHKEIIDPIMLRDDEMNVVQYFYKTTNCENYHFLPRCYLMANTSISDTSGEKAFQEQASQPQYSTATANPITSGSCRVVKLNPDTLCGSDYMQLPYNDGQGGASILHGYAPLTDNTRFTLLARETMIIDIDYDITTGGLRDQFKDNNRITPAWRKYNIYGLLNKLKVDKGYNSPNNIATRITEQLQKQEPLIKYYEGDLGAIESQPRVVTTSQDTTTYKALNCACIGNMSEINYTSWETADSITQEACDYEASYEFIGCKRPKLTMRGREVAELIENYQSNPTDDYSVIYAQGEAFIKNAIPKADALTSSITTCWEYTDANLESLRDLFIEQYKYPELFTNMPPTYAVAGRDPHNLGFLHTNTRTVNATFTLHTTTGLKQWWLGDDGYDPRQSVTKSTADFVDLYSVPLFFHVDRKNINKYNTGQSTDFLCYGFATKTPVADGHGKHFIVIHPELSKGLDEWIPATGLLGNIQLLGWDCTFSGYSSVFIGLNSGYNKYIYGGASNGVPGFANSWNVDGYVTDETLPRPQEPLPGPYPYHKVVATQTGTKISKTYIGATNSALSFLTNGHFAWEYLHEPEKQGQPYNSGSVPNATFDKDGNLTQEAIPVQTDASLEVYKINKLLNYWVWSPDYTPYQIDTVYSHGGKSDGEALGKEITSVVNTILPKATPPATEAGVSINVRETIKQLNIRIREWSIMDSHGGIFLDLGNCYTEDTWGDGLTGILGFTYNQYNPKLINDKNNVNSRVSYDNIYNLEWATTNCEIVATETDNYVMNRWGGIQYSTQLPISVYMESWGRFISPNQYNLPDTPWTYKGVADPPVAGEEYTWTIYRPNLTPLTILPNIVESTTSIQIGAEELPKKMLKPYYTIRSDIISENKYIGGNTLIGTARGGGNSLGIVAVVNKENGDGDFFFSVQSPFQFTCTKNTMLSSITTSIHSPDQSLADVGDQCCIIYKISKQRKTDPDIIQEILQNIKKSQKK